MVRPQVRESAFGRYRRPFVSAFLRGTGRVLDRKPSLETLAVAKSPDLFVRQGFANRDAARVPERRAGEEPPAWVRASSRTDRPLARRSDGDASRGPSSPARQTECRSRDTPRCRPFSFGQVTQQMQQPPPRPRSLLEVDQGSQEVDRRDAVGRGLFDHAAVRRSPHLPT